MQKSKKNNGSIEKVRNHQEKLSVWKIRSYGEPKTGAEFQELKALVDRRVWGSQWEVKAQDFWYQNSKSGTSTPRFGSLHLGQ